MSGVDNLEQRELLDVIADHRGEVAQGLGVRVLTDLTVPVTAEQGAAAREEMARAGVALVVSIDAE